MTTPIIATSEARPPKSVKTAALLIGLSTLEGLIYGAFYAWEHHARPTGYVIANAIYVTWTVIVLRGLLRGRVWAKWLIVIVYGVYHTLGIMAIHRSWNFYVSIYVTDLARCNYLTQFGLFGIAVILLFTASSRAWFPRPNFSFSPKYDRITLLVLATCGSLLAANLYYRGKTHTLKRETMQRDERLPKYAAPGNDDVRETPAELILEPPPPPTQEDLVVLANDQIEYTLTNIGGGVKFAEFKHEFEVADKTKHVRANRFGSSPIGALTVQDESPEQIAYSYKNEESVAGKKAVYVFKMPSGLIAKKTFTLNDGGEPGAPYLLDFELRLENGTNCTVNLSHWSVFLGEAAPLYEADVSSHTGFFWRTNGDITFKGGNSFRGGMFAAPQSVINSPQGAIQYAGVTNYFFATVLRPIETASTSMWARSSQVNLPQGSRPVTSVRAGLRLPAADLKPSEIKAVNYRIFIGPLRNRVLSKMNNHWGDGWDDLMRYSSF